MEVHVRTVHERSTGTNVKACNALNDSISTVTMAPQATLAASIALRLSLNTLLNQTRPASNGASTSKQDIERSALKTIVKDAPPPPRQVGVILDWQDGNGHKQKTRPRQESLNRGGRSGSVRMIMTITKSPNAKTTVAISGGG